MSVGKALPFAETQCFNLKNEGLVYFRDLQILSVKDHTVNIFSFVGLAVSATAPQLSCELSLPVSVIPVRSQFKVSPPPPPATKPCQAFNYSCAVSRGFW